MRNIKIYVKVDGMDFSKYLNQEADLINKSLEKLFNKELESVKKINPRLGVLFKKFIEASKGGKRLRGTLVLLGAKIGGSKNSKNLINAACAFEIFQTAILAQDDIIDKSETRRGKMSLPQALGGNHKAISQTICLSDLGFFLAFKILSEIPLEDKTRNEAINYFSRILIDTVLGEALDIEGEKNEENILQIAKLKTAKYTITGPLILGALLGGADKKTKDKLQKFGDNLGIAFQMQDDILSVFGKETGKPLDDDIKEGKATLLIAHALKNANYEDKRFLNKHYGNSKISSKGIAETKKIFINSGALDYANSQFEKYLLKAKGSLKAGDDELLYSLVNFLKERKR